jgi:hypothetical protein
MKDRMKEFKEEEIDCVCDTVTSHVHKGMKNPDMSGKNCVCKAGESVSIGKFGPSGERIQVRILELEARKEFNFNPADFWDLVLVGEPPHIKDGKLEGGKYEIRRKARPYHYHWFGLKTSFRSIFFSLLLLSFQSFIDVLQTTLEFAPPVKLFDCALPEPRFTLDDVENVFVVADVEGIATSFKRLVTVILPALYRLRVFTGWYAFPLLQLLP